MRAKHWETAAAVLLFVAVGSSCTASRTYRANAHTHYVSTHVHIITVGHRNHRIKHRHRAERGYLHKHDEREMHRALLAKGKIRSLPAQSNKGGHVRGKQRAAEVDVRHEPVRTRAVDRREVRHDSARVRSVKARKEKAAEPRQMANTKVKKVAKARVKSKVKAKAKVKVKDKDRESPEQSNKGGDVRGKDRAGEVRGGA